jgi:peptidoglycan/xylan/chitin deacetylase (PgdA/CDA1 family)
MEELEMFLDKKIRVPKDTVAITLDDGIFLDNSIPLVEKYKIYATFFIITSKVDVTKYFDSKYARFESHTDDLHNNYKCPLNKPTSQGGQMLCEEDDNIVADLKLSQEKLDESYYFAYPFFDYNDNAIKALKEAGFKMAFIGQLNTNGYSDSKTDRYLLRRKTIFGNLSMQGFIDYLI